MKNMWSTGFVLMILFFITSCEGSPVSIKLKIVDDDNTPVENAHVALGFLLSEGSNSFKDYTDKYGLVTASRFGRFGTSYLIKKEGYYQTGGRFGYGDQDATVILRKKENPIGMYAKKTSLYIGEYVTNGWIGYDFMKGDFLPPHGQGSVKDFDFNYKYVKTDFWNHRYDLAIRFPNTGDGLVAFKVRNYTSKFSSDYKAPELGYESSMKYYEYRSGSEVPVETNLDDNRRYYFRVRTELDEDGKVVSAFYGKLYSEFSDLNYYLNPNNNDRNIEFDREQNLFRNLSKEERVLEP